MAGISKHITGNVTLDGVTYTPVTLAAVFSAALAAIKLADSQYTQWIDDVKAQDAALATANALYKALKQFAIGQFGANNTTVLTDLGIAPPKTKPAVSAATKAAAALKADATRKARGTTSAKQKKSVKGNVEVQVTTVPVVTVPAATPSPAPAAPAAPAASPAAGSAKPVGS